MKTSPTDYILDTVKNCLSVKTKKVMVAWAGVRSDGTTFNASFTETSEGKYTITFNSPHPSNQGGWLYSAGGAEDTARDNPKVTLIQGTDTLSGAQVMVTVDDNGLSADIFEDNEYSFIVYAEEEVISEILFDGMPLAGNREYPLAGDKLELNNFRDQDDSNFLLDIENMTASSINWQVKLENTPYATIPNLSSGNFELISTYNGDFTWTHLFQSTDPLTPFQRIFITATPVEVSGTDTQVSLYCENA